jgi:hypothetical protein
MELTHNSNSICQQLLPLNRALSMMDFLVYPVDTQGTVDCVFYMRSILSLSLFNCLFIFSICSFAYLVSPATCFVLSCHKVISQDIWSTIHCSCWITWPGMIVGSPILGFIYILDLTLISFSSLAICFSSSFIDSFSCSSPLSNSKYSKLLVGMMRGVPLSQPLPVVLIPLGHLDSVCQTNLVHYHSSC